MTLDHETLDVYHLSTGYVAWVYDKAETLIKVLQRGEIAVANNLPRKDREPHFDLIEPKLEKGFTKVTPSICTKIIKKIKAKED